MVLAIFVPVTNSYEEVGFKKILCTNIINTKVEVILKVLLLRFSNVNMSFNNKTYI